MSAMDSIRNLELVQFERDNTYIVFHPETLSIFRLNRKAAEMIRDARENVSDDELSRKYRVTPEQLDRSVAPILAPIQSRTRSVAGADSSSLLKRDGLLPKAVLMVNNYCNL